MLGNITALVNGVITDFPAPAARSSYRTMLKDVVARVEERLKVVGLSASRASLVAGLSVDAIRNMKRAAASGKERHGVSTATITALAPVLETTAGWLLGEEGTAPPALVSSGEVRVASIPIPDFASLPRDVPVYGTASGAIVSVPGRGGKAIEGFTLDRSKVTEFVRRPPALAGAPDVYAIYVAGESMAPKIEPGELRFVHPQRPPRGGDMVLILVEPGAGQPLQAFLKRYIGNTAGGISAEQLNPQAVVTFKADTVVGVHRVLTMNELFTG